ncbi:hypothetical protein BPA30113_03072 [Burkholderia paludis]|uniref:Uncharacterized protein n=1 Tax=Burkholderia paludis TaxID=1506587 RepID=A0A6J5EPQ4_9BURK|nr:hypothetical protein LMG30113_05374 [Burkholderia paludis]VWB68464.1 hypothetical protein BPA30113_03072 [Burkholderia paludis]
MRGVVQARVRVCDWWATRRALSVSARCFSLKRLGARCHSIASAGMQSAGRPPRRADSAANTAWRVMPVRCATRARCGYPAAETTRGPVYFDGERWRPIGWRAAPGAGYGPSALVAPPPRWRSAHSRPCGYPAPQATRSPVTGDGEGVRDTGRRYPAGAWITAAGPTRSPVHFNGERVPAIARQACSGVGIRPVEPRSPLCFRTERVTGGSKKSGAADVDIHRRNPLAGL